MSQPGQQQQQQQAAGAGKRDQLHALARRLGIQPVTDVRRPASSSSSSSGAAGGAGGGGGGRRGANSVTANSAAAAAAGGGGGGISPESTGTYYSSTSGSSPSGMTTTSTGTSVESTPDRYLMSDTTPYSANQRNNNNEENYSDDSYYLQEEGGRGGGGSERGALHKSLAMARQDNRALRAQIERMRAREIEIVSLGVQAQTQISSASQQLDGLKKRVRQELCHPIDETTYQKLISEPESQLDLFDTIRIAVYQQLGELQQSRDRSVQELRDAAQRFQDSEDFAKKARFEMDQLQRQHQHEVGSLEDRIEILTKRCEGLELSAKTAALSLDSNESKAARFDALENELRRVSSSTASIEEDRQRLQGKATHLTTELNETRDELQRIRLQLHNTQTELKFSAREREMMSARNSELESAHKRSSEALEEFRASRAAAGSVIGQEREELRQSYDKQLEAATKRLRDGYEADLSRVRELSKEASDRECALLRESRDHATKEVSQLRQQVAQLESDYTSLKDTSKQKIDSAEREVFELRIEVSNKTHDSRRHDLANQEATSEIQRLKTDRDCLQKKLDVLKQEFYDTRAAFQQQVAILQAKVEGQEGQLEMFKSLETEAEVFMQHLASSSSSSPTSFSSPGSGDELEGGGIHGLLDVPSSRRAAHTISVTKRCLALENQVSLLKHEAGMAEIRTKKMGEQLDRCKAALSDSNSPYLLLEKGIEQRDDEIQRLRERLSFTEQELSAAMRRVQCLAKDVQVLTAHRAEVLRLRDALRGLSPNNNNNQSNNAVALEVAVNSLSNSSPTAVASSSSSNNNVSHQQQQQDQEQQPQQQQVQGGGVTAEGSYEFRF